jgi:hypothetical protein
MAAVMIVVKLVEDAADRDGEESPDPRASSLKSRSVSRAGVNDQKRRR